MSLLSASRRHSLSSAIYESSIVDSREPICYIFLFDHPYDRGEIILQLRFIKMKMRFNELYFPAVFLLALICFFTVPNLAVAKGQTFLVEFQDPDFLKILDIPFLFKNGGNTFLDV